MGCSAIEEEEVFGTTKVRRLSSTLQFGSYWSILTRLAISSYIFQHLYFPVGGTAKPA
jgi:hypothetical protein